MSKNINMRKAAAAKNDEFYTQISDIEKEIKYYKDHFKNKVVFCNCDDPEWSNFWKYFSLNFEYLGLKKLVATHFREDQPSYKLEIMHDINGDGKINGLDTVKTLLKQNGDFRSAESVAILKEADIVVTNPPFSLFNEYVDLLTENNKKFLIVGNYNAATNKDIFKRIMKDEMWIGVSPRGMNFALPDKSMKGVNACWFTNLKHANKNQEIILFKKYKGNEELYPKFDNYDAINIDRIKDIPMDYEGVMGVPITFLENYSKNQFEIIDCFNRYSKLTGPTDSTRGKYLSQVNGQAKYTRIAIINKKVIKGQ